MRQIPGSRGRHVGSRSKWVFRRWSVLSISSAGAHAVFIPVGHDLDGLRRWPVVTFAIIAVCSVVFVANRVGPQGSSEVTAERFHTAAEYYLEHPELDGHPLLQRWLDGALESQEPEVRDELRARVTMSDRAAGVSSGDGPSCR